MENKKNLYSLMVISFGFVLNLVAIIILSVVLYGARVNSSLNNPLMVTGIVIYAIALITIFIGLILKIKANR